MPRSSTWPLVFLLVAACGGGTGQVTGTEHGPSRDAGWAQIPSSPPMRADASASSSADAPTEQTEPPAATTVAGAAGASGASAGSAGTPEHADTAATRAPDLTHTFEPITLPAAQERSGLCQSWTLNNEQPIYVNEVVSSNEGGFHHSNWIWVNDTDYAGPDGTWPCSDRGFDQIFAGAFGGVFFAQSTQSRMDTQAFPEGVAFEMPAHVRIIGDVHLLNARDAEITTSLHFDVYTLKADEVRVPLQPMAFTNTALDIAPQGETHARMQCATPQPDFEVYYILPHFHALGERMRVDLAGGPMDGKEIFRSSGAIGETLGKTFDPPLAVTGALGLAMTCEYRNPRDATVLYGEGDQEMCVVLIYSTGKKAGGTAISNVSVSDEGGVHSTDALCVSVGDPT